jgi:hypothetical protein
LLRDQTTSCLTGIIRQVKLPVGEKGAVLSVEKELYGETVEEALGL